MGPVINITIGLFAERPPISCAGTVLSHPYKALVVKCRNMGIILPPIMIHASTGWALTISSVSILIRFRRNILVGLEKDSWMLIVGKSIARPPVS